MDNHQMDNHQGGVREESSGSECPAPVWLETVGSTHTLLKEAYADAPAFTLVAARNQTSGRGQRGNSWEAEPGCNLTFSMILRPDRILPRQQFILSEAFALSVVALLEEEGISAKVKWPNDIYVGDRKICGILIDHSLQGSGITRSVASAGLNVNQITFRSDAPNPVSMRQLTGLEYPLIPLLERLQRLIVRNILLTRSEEGRANLHRSFMEKLYRNDGQWHPYYDNRLGAPLSARLVDVAPDGMLTLQPEDLRLPPRTFAFKEVSFLI